jgi:hypothetical protein
LHGAESLLGHCHGKFEHIKDTKNYKDSEFLKRQAVIAVVKRAVETCTEITLSRVSGCVAYTRVLKRASTDEPWCLTGWQDPPPETQ